MPLAKEQESKFKRLSIKPLHVKLPDNANPTLWFSTIITEFTDSWTPRWSPTNVYGRMDPVSFYSGTGRELTLGFRVISDSADEAKENMAKIQRLIQYQYPTYKKHTGTGVKLLSAPPYFEIRFMNVVGGKGKTALRGYINGALQINPGFQTKEQSQYFSEGFEHLYFSDVTIVLRMTVLHEKSIGFTSSDFNQSNTYPYGVKGAALPQLAPGSPAGQSESGAGAVAAVDAQAQQTAKEKGATGAEQQDGVMRIHGGAGQLTAKMMMSPQFNVGLGDLARTRMAKVSMPRNPNPGIGDNWEQKPKAEWQAIGKASMDAAAEVSLIAERDIGRSEFDDLANANGKSTNAEATINKLAAEIRQMQSKL